MIYAQIKLIGNIVVFLAAMSLINENELQKLKQDFLDFEKDAMGMNQELFLKKVIF